MKKLSQIFIKGYSSGETGNVTNTSLLFIGIIITFFYLLLLSFFIKSLVIVVGLIFIITYFIITDTKFPNITTKFVNSIVHLFGEFIGILVFLGNWFFSFFSSSYISTAIVFLYIFLVVSNIQWGIPNNSHPFMYHMDEWHQLQSVRGIVTEGSPNIPGAAHGPIFQFFLTNIFLIPFVFMGVIQPFSIQSPITDVDLLGRLFMVLRLNTLFFGILSAVVLGKIAQELKIKSYIPLFFLLISPSFLMFSNYFKYDIALLFWIIVSFYLLIVYIKRSSSRIFIFAAITSGLATATKITGLPLLLLLIVAFFISSKNKNIKLLSYGIFTFFLVFICFGIPDLILGKGNYIEYFYSNLVTAPKETDNYFNGLSYVSYLLLRQFPINFGHGTAFLLVVSLITIFSSYSLKKIKSNKTLLFLLITFIIFAISLIPMKLFASGNRALVLLPFIALIISTGITLFLQFKYKLFILLFIFLTIFFQVSESLVWISIKWNTDVRLMSSEWIIRNIPYNTTIGIENIPIYQMIPDILLKEFYTKQYMQNYNEYYKLGIIDNKNYTHDYVVLTNTDIVNYQNNSVKKELIESLKENNYVKIITFTPEFGLYKLFGNNLDFYIPILMQTPVDITIYKKI